LGQGKENVRAFLQENTDIRQQIEDALLVKLGVKEAAAEEPEASKE
jgi:recombination protein RecA